MVAAAMLAVGAPKPAKAANIFWDANDTVAGTGGAGTWLNAGSPSWVNAGAATSITGTDPAIDYAFTANDIGYFTGEGAEVTLGENITVGGLVFTGVSFATRNDYALTGSTLTLATPVGLTAPTLRVDLGARVTISSQLAGTDGLIKTGNGTLVLTNLTNTLDGGIFIKAGAVVVTDSAQLGLGSRPIMVTGWGSTGSPGITGGALVVQAPDAINGITFSRDVSASGRGPGSLNGSGALVSVGSNTFTGAIGLGGSAASSRFTAASGVTTFSGDVHLGAGSEVVFYGNGNTVISGEVNNHDYSQDRIIKTGLIYGTTLWLQNDQNTFTSGIRIDSGTVRVGSAGALGLNFGRLAVDLNNGRLEVRSDLLGDFASKNVYVRDGTNSYVFVDHALDSAAVGGNFQFGELNAARNNTWFYLNSRNGFGATFSGLFDIGTGGNLIGGGGGNNAGINNDGNGLLILDANLWKQGDGTARRFYIRGNGDTLVTGSILQSHATAAHAFSKEGLGYLTLLGTAGTTRGSVDIVGGTVEIRGVGAFANASTINLGGGSTTSDQPGTLVYAGAGETLAKPILLAGKRANSIPMLVSSGTGALVLTGAITAADTVSKTFRLGGTNADDNTIASTIANNSGTITTSLQKMGSGTWVLAPTANNTLTGTTTVTNGALKLREVSANVDILPDASAVVFNVDPFSYAAGGLLRYEGAAASLSTETLGALTPTAGHAQVQSAAVGGGTAALTFASLAARGAGATLDLSSVNGGTIAFTGATTGSNGIVGGWATFGGVDWLATGSAAAALSSYAPLASSGLSATDNYLSAADLTVAGAESVNSLKLAGAQTLTLGGLLTIGTGGVLFNNSTGAATITGGTLGASATEVIVTTAGSNSANALTISSLISGGAGSFTKAGEGLVVITGANAYTGATTINQGSVQMSGATAALGSNSNLNLRQGTTLDLNGAGASVSTWNTAVAAPRILIGALAGTGTVVNTNAAPSILSLGNGNGNGTFNGLISQAAGAITVVKNGSGTQSLTGLNTYTGPTVIRGGTLAVNSLASIGQPSSIGRGDATDAATNAGSLIFENGILLYTGSQGTTYDNNRVVNIFQATQTPSVAIDRLFTLAGNAEIQSYGTYGSGTMGRTDNNAALVFTNTGDVAFLGAGNRTLTLSGNSNGDNQINLRLIDNPNGGTLSVNRTGYTAYWTLGNQNNAYSGPTSISGGALIAIDGASLPTASNLRFSQDWAGNSFFQSVGTFDRQVGAGADQWQAGPLTGFAGFAADRSKFVVDWTGQNLIWGNADGTSGFLKGSTLALNNGNSLAEIEVRGNFEIRPNAAVPTGLVANASTTATITLTGGNASLISVGQLVTGTGVPANTYITGFNTATQINLSQNVNVAAGVALAVSGAGWRDILVNDNGFTGLDYATISGVISGTGNLGKQGGGPLILGDANTFSGNMILRNEQLIVSSIGADGVTSSSLGTNVSGGWLELGNPGGGNSVTLTYVGGGEITTRAIYLTGTTGVRRIESSGSGPLTLTNLLNTSSTNGLTAFTSTNNRQLELRGVNTDFNTISSDLANASSTQALRVYKADQGLWVLAGANTFTGGVRVDGGSLGFTTAAAMGSRPNAGGTVNAMSNSKTVVLQSGNTTGLAVGTYVNGPGLGFGDTVASVTNSTTFTLTASGNRSMAAGHPVVFGGLMLSNGAVFSADPAGLTLDFPVIINNNSTGGFTGLAPITVNANIHKIQGGNDITLSNSLENGAVLTINGDYVSWQNDSSLTTRVLNIRGQGAYTDWNGVIKNGLTANSNTRLSLSVPNASVLRLGGATPNTHTGGVYLYQGSLLLAKAGALGTGPLELQGGTVRGDGIVLTGANKITNLVRLWGEATKFVGTDSIELGGVLQNGGGNRYLFNDIAGAGTLNLTGGVQLSNDSTNRILVLQGAGTTNFASPIVNGSTSTSGSLYLRGTGTANLTAANTFGGELRVDRGTAVLSGAGTLAGGVYVRNKGEFVLDNDAQNLARISGRAVQIENGALFRLIGNAAGTTETAGALTLREGAGRILMSGAGVNTLGFASVSFANSGSVLDLYGITDLGVSNFVKFTAVPSHANYVQGVETRIGVAGDDFAAYSAASNANVVAFSGYAGVTTLADAALVATATAKVTSAYSADDLTAMRSTLNALAVSDATARDISGPQFSTLSLTSGGLLFGRAAGVGPVTHTLSVPRLELGSAAAPVGGYFQVMDGVTVDLTGQVTAGSTFTKMGAGTLLLSSRQFWSSTTNITGGTIKLGLDNAIYPSGQNYFVNALGGTFDLNGFTQYTGYMSNGGQTDGGGLVTSSTGAGTFVTNLPGASVNFHGTTSGANVNFGRVGGYTYTMTGALGHGGVTVFAGGSNTLTDEGSILNTSELILNYATFTVDTNGSIKLVNNNRISDSAPVTMRGGVLVYSGLAREDVGERFGALTIAEGGNTLTANNGGGDWVTTTMSFPSLTRAAGTTVNFTGSNLGMGGQVSRIVFDAPLASQPNGILGAWAIANWNDYAAYDPINGVGVVGQGGYGVYAGTFGPGKNTQLVAVQDTVTALPAGGATSAVLKLAGRASNRVTFAAPGDVLNLQYGGLLRSNDAFDGIIGDLTSRGVLTAGGTESSGVRELVIFNQAKGNPTFGSAATTSGSPVVTGVYAWGLRPGMTVTNGNFITGTTVVSVDTDNQVTLSTNATASATGQTLTGGSFVSGATTSGSTAVSMNSTVGIGPGMTITGTGIPVGAFVVSVDGPTQVTISRPAESTQSNRSWTVGVSELVVNSVIADNGAGNSVALTKSGNGTLTLTAANTYTGGTVVNQGVVNVTASANGIVVIPAGGVTVNGGQSNAFAWLNVLSQGAIDASNAVTINGSGRLTFPNATDNALVGLTFNNSGGEYGGSNLSYVGVGTNSILRLSSLTPIVATSNNARITSSVAGGNLLLAPGVNTISVAGIRLPGEAGVYAELTPTLNITSNVTGTGVSVVKTGDGLLQLGGQNSFSGGLTVSAGGVVLGSSSTPQQGGLGLASGPLGAGAVTFAAGTTLFVDNNDRAIGNDLVFSGLPTFNNTGTTRRTLTLNGELSLGQTAGVAPVRIDSPYLVVAMLGQIPNIADITSFQVQGLGQLVFNAAGYTGDFYATALGNTAAVSLLADGDGSAQPQTITLPGAVIFDAGIVPNITVGRAGGTLPLNQALNKTIAPGAISNLGSGLTLTNNNGYGLLVSQPLTVAANAVFSVSGASLHNVTQGLTFAGKVSGAGLTKTGNGTLVLGDATNDFIGDVVVQRGGLSISADGQLGDAANKVVLAPTGGTSFLRFTDDLVFGRTIALGNTANTRQLEVAAGKTVTLTSAFDVTAGATAALVKQATGTLVLGADNTGWSGQFNINQGVVQVSAANQLTSGKINVGGMTAALELAGGVTLANAVDLTSTGNWANITGIDSAGAIRATAGVNTITGTLTLANARPDADNANRYFGVGADVGATLTLGAIRLDHASGNTNRNSFLYFLGKGTINLNGTVDNTNGSPGNHFVYQIDDNILNVTSANTFLDTNFRIFRGVTNLTGAGTLGSVASRPVVIYQDGKLVLDNTLTNTANRLGTANRNLDMRGGVLEVIPNAAGTSNVTSAVMTVFAGGSTINLLAGGNNELKFGSLGTSGGGTLNLTGTFGTSTNKLTFNTAPGQSNGLIPRLTVNGDSFATYSSSNGVIAFTAYSSAQNILSASATATYQATSSKANALTGAQSISALALTSDGVAGPNLSGLGGLNPSTLTITSGAVLVNGTGTGSTLAVPVVAFGGAEAIFHTAAGQTLSINSSMTGTNGMTKSLPGTVVLNSPQFISGNTTVNAGTLQLKQGAVNTLWYGIGGLGVNNGATLDLNGSVQYAGNFYANDIGGQQNARGGSVVNTDSSQATLAFNGQSSFNGVISGDIAVVKVGTGTTTFNFPQTYSGPTEVIGNINVADTGSLLNTSSFDVYRGRLAAINDTGSLYYVSDRFSDTAPITLRGGEILLNGRPSTDVTERFGAVTLVEGHNAININNGGWSVASTNIILGGLTRVPGSSATLRFNNLGAYGQPNGASAKIDGGLVLANGIIGPWAIIDRAFATYDATAGVSGLGVGGASGYSGEGLLSGPGATDNVLVRDTAVVRLLEDTTVHTLNFYPAGGSGTLDLDGRRLVLAGGGMMSAIDGDNRTNTFRNGTITSGLAGGDLYLHVANYSGTNRITNLDAVVADNGAQPVRLISSAGDGGTSVINVNGTNTYTGGTVINRGTFNLGASATLGSGGLTVAQGLFTQALGAVIPEQPLSVGSGATVTLANQANTFTSLTVTNNATLNLTGTATVKGGVTVTSRDPSRIASLANGTLNLDGQAAAAFDIGAHMGNGVAVAPLQPSLNVVSVIENGGIVKTGDGVLQLTGASTFSGGVTVSAGGLAIGGNSNPLSGAVTSGPLGTGLLTMAAGTRLISTGSWTVGNDATFLGDTVFATTSTSAAALTINGVATLPSTWNVDVVNPLLTVSLADASPSTATDVINKSGLGILNVGNYAGTIQVVGGVGISADGNGRGTFQEIAIGGDVLISGSTAITVNRSGSAPYARNKILQKGALSIDGSILSVTNLSGYGLEFTGATTLTGPAHFSVGVASTTVQNSGLILTGAIDDGANDFGLVKSGPGTLELRGVNTFGAAGQTIDILGGVLAANSDAALGAAGNTVTLNADGLSNVGFRAIGTFSTARTFVLGQANNTVDVALGSTLTLTSPFQLDGGAAAKLGKNYGGVLAITADNTGWTGAITVTGGALRLGDDNAAGSGAITVAPNDWRGIGLELFNDVTVSNPLSLQGGNNVLYGGTDFSGQLSSFSGDNTYAGPITFAYDAAIGARSGSTLRVTGGITNTANRALAFNADLNAAIIIDGTAFALGGSATKLYSVRKHGLGTLSIRNANTIPVDTAQWFHLKGGLTVLEEAGTWSSRIYVDKGSSLWLDDRSITASGVGHVTANGRLGTNSTNAKEVGFRGGELLIRGSLTSTDSLIENIAKPTFARGATTITLEQNAAGKMTLVFWASPDNIAPAQNTTTSGLDTRGASVLFRGDNFGISNDPGNSNVVFAGGSVLNGQTGSNGTTSKGIFPWALVDTSRTGLGTSFATVSNTGSGGTAGSNDRIVRPLNPSEYSTTVSTNNNILLSNVGNRAVNSNVTPNSLTFSGSSNLVLADGVKLNLRSGGILVRDGGTTTISGGVLDQTSGYSPLNIWTVGSAVLTIDTSINGGNGNASGRMSMIKAGAGTLVLNPPTSPIVGLTTIGTNSLSGQFVLNEGTVRLGAGLTNAIQSNNYAALVGGTLDLNGGSQYFYGVFADQDYATDNTIVTNSAATTAHFLYNNDNSTRNWSGSIQGDVKFTRSGQNTTNFYVPQTYTGSTVINGGNVLLRDEARLVSTPSIEINYGGLYFDNANGTIGLPDRVNDAAAITLRGGILELRGRQQAASREALGVVTLAASNSFINVTGSGVAGSSTQLDIARLDRAVGGGTVNFTGANGLIGTSTRVVIANLNGTDLSDPAAPNAGLTGGILGGWAIVGTSDFATSIPGLGVAALGADGFPTYSNLTSATNTIALAAPTDNVNINAVVAGAVVVAADTTLNSLRMGNVGTGGTTVNIVDIAADKTLTLTSGGLLFYSSAGHSVGAVNGQGTLTSGGPELFVYTQGSGDKRIRANIADGGQSVAFTKSGNAVLRLSGANTYTGGTFVNQGTLHIEGSSNVPAAADPLKGLVISGATLNIFTAGRIAPENYVTIAGAGVLNYIGDNTQYGIVLDNVGSSGNPTIRSFNTLNASGLGSKGVLTVGAGGITATSANVGTISIIEGRLSFGAAGGTIDVGAIDVNGVADVDPLRATLQLQAIYETSGAISKTGDGVLQLNAQSRFTGDFNVLAGGLRNAVGNAGSRFADLTIAAGARYDLGGQTTTWGSLAGSGDIFSASGTPTLNVGYNNSDSTFSGRLMRFNDAAYPLLTKVGTGTLTMDSVQVADGSWSTIRVEGGRLLYSGAGRAFPATVASAASVFSVDDGAVLELSNAASAVDHRLALNVAGTLEQRGGTLVLGGSASAAVTERITTVSPQFGSGRIELRPDAAQPLLLDVGTLSGGNSHATLLFAGLSGAAQGAGLANLRIGTVNYLGNVAAQGTGANGTTNRSIRGDVLADDSASGKGDGFLVRDVVAVGGLTLLNNGSTDYVLTLPSAAGITLGANVSGLGVSGNWTVGAINGNDVTLTGGTTLAPGSDVTVSFSNYWRALRADELNTAPRGLLGDGVGGWAAGENAGVSSAQTISVDTVVNSLTFSGTASLGSGLGASFGAFGPGGRVLNLQLQGATAFLVKDGTTTFTAGALTSGTGTTMFGHVLQGATLNFDAGSAFGLGATGGFVKAGDGLLNFNAPIYLGATNNFTVNGGRVNLNSGFANTLPVQANTSGGAAMSLRIEGLNALVDLRGQPQMVNELRSSNEKPGQGGTLTNSLASVVNFTTYGNSVFSGVISGNLNLVRSGNTTTLLTNASSYSGLTVVRGGNLQLRDAGALTGTSAVQVNNGALILDNYGLNPVENVTRLNPAVPVFLSGGEFRVDGSGSSDVAVRVNSLTAGSGRNTINVRPYVNMGGTVRVDVGDLVLAPNARQIVNINGWSTANSGGYNTLGNQSLTGSGMVFLEKVNGATGPANYNFTSVATTNGSRIVTLDSTEGLTPGLAISGTNMPSGATISAIVSATQIQISANATVTSSAGTLRATNLVNNLIGGWAVANGSTFATYDSRYGVLEMGYSSGGFSALGFTGTDLNSTVATGNYNDGTATRTITGAKAANSWRMGPSAAQTITFATNASLTLGVGIITNANQLVRLAATDATNTITSAGGELYVFVNQNALEIEPKLTGSMALVSSGGATVRLKPKSASNDYTGGTFVNAGTLTLDGTAGLIAIPGDITLQNAVLNMSSDQAKAGQIAANANLTIKGHGRFLLPDYTNMVAGTNVVNRLATITFITDGAQGSNPDVALANPNDVAAFSVLALSGTNAITSTNQTSGRVPTVYTGDSARTRLVFDNVAPVITVNDGEGLVGLNLNAPITQGSNAALSAEGFADMTSLTKTGGGTLAMIHADSDFTADFVLAQGSLLLGGSSTASGLGGASKGPVGAGTLVIEGGTALLTDGTARTLHNPVTINGDFTFGGQVGAGVTLVGPVSLGGAARTISIPSAGLTATFNGTLSTSVTGATALTKEGAGTLRFGATSSLSFADAGLTVAGGLVQAGKAEQLPADTLLTVVAGAGYDLAGFNQTLNVIAGDGFISNSSNTPATLTLDVASAVGFAGVLADNRAVSAVSASELALVKSGAGTLTLTGASTYAGETSIQDGKVVVGAGGSLGTGDVIITTELEYARTDTFALANAFTSTGTGSLSFVGVGGVAKLVGNSVTAGLNVVVGAGSTLQLGDDGVTGELDGAAGLSLGLGSVLRFSRSDVDMPAFSAAITSDALNDGLIVQAGTGKTSIVSALGFSGDVQVEAGELVAANVSALEAARLITIGSAGTFTVADSALGYGTNGLAPNVVINGGLMRLFESTAAALGAVHDLTLNGGTVSSGVASPFTSSLYVTGAIHVTNDAVISAENVAFVEGGVGSVPTDVTVDATKTLTFSGTLADDYIGVASSFDKKGAGTLVLSGDNAAMTGASVVSAGVLDVRHVNALGDGLAVNQSTSFTAQVTVSGGALVSNQANFGTAGVVAGNIIVATGGSIGVAAPGAAVIGNLSVANLTLQSGSRIDLKIWDAAQGAGVGFDQLDLGTLDLTGASSANRITIKLISMSAANAFGDSTLVQPTSTLDFVSYNIGSYDPLLSSLGSGNVSDLFTFDASEFTYANGSASDAGLWSIDFNAGAITLTAVPEPSTYGFGLGALALAAAALRRRRRQENKA